MLDWLTESWTIYILFLAISYYILNSQVDRAARKADAAEFRARKAERTLEDTFSQIHTSSNECVELRKRVSYLEEKMDEYVRVLEALAIPIAALNAEEVTERLALRAAAAQGGIGSAVGMASQVGLATSGVQNGSSPHGQQQQPSQNYTAKMPDKERVGRVSSGSDQSISSSTMEKIAGLKSKLESGKESVISALNNFPRKRSQRGSKPGSISSSFYSVVPGRTFGRPGKGQRTRSEIEVR